MLTLIYLLLFFLGLGIGSFFNVVSVRYEPDKAFDFRLLKGRSRCPHCRKTLEWFELIPLLSFLFQKGRCRKCQERISLQYPIIELLGGIALVAVPAYLNQFYGAGRLFILNVPLGWYYLLGSLWIMAFLTLLLISAIDIRHSIIPNGLTLALFVLGAGIVFIKSAHLPGSFEASFLGRYAILFSLSNIVWLNHLAGAALAAGAFAGLAFLTKENAMGWGDVKLAGALGWLLGAPDIFLAVAIAFFFGGAASAVLVLLKRKKIKGHIPFGPFLALGAFVVFFAGEKILSLYFSFF